MNRYRLHEIERIVCLRFRLTAEDLRGRSRERRIVRPRQIAMYLARLLAGASYPKIAGHFGGRDHVTALYAVRKIAAMEKQGGRMAVYLRELKAMLDEGDKYERQAKAEAQNDGRGAGDRLA